MLAFPTSRGAWVLQTCRYFFRDDPPVLQPPSPASSHTQEQQRSPKSLIGAPSRQGITKQPEKEAVAVAYLVGFVGRSLLAQILFAPAGLRWEPQQHPHHQ